jgi:hypothetical protein
LCRVDQPLPALHRRGFQLVGQLLGGILVGNPGAFAPPLVFVVEPFDGLAVGLDNDSLTVIAQRGPLPPPGLSLSPDCELPPVSADNLSTFGNRFAPGAPVDCCHCSPFPLAWSPLACQLQVENLGQSVDAISREAALTVTEPMQCRWVDVRLLAKTIAALLARRDFLPQPLSHLLLSSFHRSYSSDN